MTHTNLIKSKWKLSLLFFAVATLSACGGSADKPAAGDETTFNTAYKGSTSAAIVNQAFYDATVNNTIPEQPIVQSSSTLQTINSFNSLSSIKSGLVNKYSNIKPNKIITDGPTTTPCAVSGSNTTTSVVDDQSGEFSLTLKFNLCEEYINTTDSTTEIIDGILLASGVYDKTNSENNKITIALENLSIKSTDVDVLENGYFKSAGDTDNVTTLDIVVEDKIKNESVYFNNLETRTITTATEQTVTLSGKIYFSEYGYVTYQTTDGNPVITDTNAINPRSGQIQLMGKAESTDQSATITITYLTVDSYKVEADYDGDGIAEVILACTWVAGCV